MTARDRHTEASSTGYDESGHDTQPERCGAPAIDTSGCVEVGDHATHRARVEIGPWRGTWLEWPASSSPPADDRTPLDPDVLARRFHETYERLAPQYGYATREASAKPWAEVPEQNKALMVAVCVELMAGLLAENAARARAEVEQAVWECSHCGKGSQAHATSECLYEPVLVLPLTRRRADRAEADRAEQTRRIEALIREWEERAVSTERDGVTAGTYSAFAATLRAALADPAGDGQ